VDELLDVRALLEAETARLAAVRAARGITGDGGTSAAQLARLREICLEGKAAAQADDFDAAVLANNAFHVEVAAIGGNAVLAELAEIVGRRVQWYYRMVAPARGHWSWAEHAEIIEAIESGEADRAQALARKHTERTRQAYHRPRPKLRVVRMPRPPLACAFAPSLPACPGYLRSVSGIAASMSWNAWRCSLVGSARTGTGAGVPAKRSSLRVRVARWSRRPWKLR
jgi:hypothetical protein